MMNFANILPVLSATITPTTGSEVSRNMAKKLAATYRMGANMDCLVFDDVVVKWARQGKYHVEAGNDVEFFSKVDAQDVPYFASTTATGMFIVQERIEPLIEDTKTLRNLDRNAGYSMLMMLVELATKYNLFDLHSGNVGFRKSDDVPTPVIFDYSAQRNWKESLASRVFNGENRRGVCECFLSMMSLPTRELLPPSLNDKFEKEATDLIENMLTA
jgi:hypothetical protein